MVTLKALIHLNRASPAAQQERGGEEKCLAIEQKRLNLDQLD